MLVRDALVDAEAAGALPGIIAGDMTLDIDRLECATTLAVAHGHATSAAASVQAVRCSGGVSSGSRHPSIAASAVAAIGSHCWYGASASSPL